MPPALGFENEATQVVATMNPSEGNQEPHRRARFVEFRDFRRPSREFPLVKLAAWMVIVGAIALVILIIWGLATHDPSQQPFDNDF